MTYLNWTKTICSEEPDCPMPGDCHEFDHHPYPCPLADCNQEFGEDHSHDEAECDRMLDVMAGVGVEQPDRGWDPDEAHYLPGSGELDGDPSYIAYLNSGH